MTKRINKNILVVDDDLAFRVGTLALLEDRGYSAVAAKNGEEAKTLLAQRSFDLVLSDLVMPDINGIELLKHIELSHPEIPVIMVTGFASVSTAVEAMRMGARDYVTKPCENDELVLKVERALAEREKDVELKHLREEVTGTYQLRNMVGRSEKMKETFKLVMQVAATDVPVLVLGETGTGKELIAKAIHYNSARRDRPFVVINCSTLAESLLESELFGHEKGAFTGAHQQRLGKFEEASGGTIFLDEIGDIPPQVQVKLLRVLQEAEIQRVGSNETVTVDSRIVAATNRDLPTMIASGQFREDLYYRINVFPVHIPPLRDRLDDLPALVEHFIDKHNALSGGRVTQFSPALYPAMMKAPWKGNIRELENLLKRAIIKTPGDTITSMDIPGGLPEEQLATTSLVERLDMNTAYKDYLAIITRHAEETYLVHMLQLYGGNINQIAKLMEIDRKTVYRKMSELHIDPENYRR